MDIVADASLVLRLPREEILDETLPWLLHVLHRDDVRQAALAKTAARSAALAAQCMHGGRDAANQLADFFSEMDRVIQRDPFAPPSVSSLLNAEIAAFERLEKL